MIRYIFCALLLVSFSVNAAKWKEPEWGEFTVTKAHCVDSAFMVTEAFRQHNRGVPRDAVISSLLNPTLMASVSHRVSLPAIISLLHDRYAGINTYTHKEVWDVIYGPCKRTIGTKVRYVVK